MERNKNTNVNYDDILKNAFFKKKKKKEYILRAVGKQQNILCCEFKTYEALMKGQFLVKQTMCPHCSFTTFVNLIYTRITASSTQH